MRTHRGLSAVIGTVFLVAVVVGALSYVSYALDIMGNFSESMITEESRQQAKQDEAFQIQRIEVLPGDTLGGVIKNSGQIPVELKTLYIDEQGANDVVQKFTLNAAISPGNTINIQDLIDVPIDPTKGYNMKVVSSRGDVKSFYVNSVAEQNVYMELTASPTIIPSTFTTTLYFTIVNNMTDGNYLYNLTPVMNDTGQILQEGSLGLQAEQISDASPASYDSLGPGEVAVFTYVYELTGDTELDTQWFNATLANANPGNEALASASIKSVPLAAEAGSSLTSLQLTDAATDLPDVMFFHTDTTLAPNSEYQMDGSSPNTGGFTIGLNEAGTLEFLSAGMIEDVTVPAGDFIVRLNYFSNIVPLGFPEPQFAFMMDCWDCGDDNEIASSVNNFDQDKGLKGDIDGNNVPDFSGLGGSLTPGDGPDGDEFYHFDEGTDEYFWDDWGVNDNDSSQIGCFPDSTAFWGRMPPTGDTHMPILAAEECCDDGHNDYYGFWLIDAGDIRFAFDTAHEHHGGAPDRVRCDSPAADGIVYDTNTWHHIVGVRDDKYGCRLYIDGKLMANLNPGDLGDDYVDNDSWGIGWSVYNNEHDDFEGDIGSFIHWNDDALSAEQVEDLYYTNYGINGTWFDYRIEVVDETGLVLVDTIASETKANVPFKDPALGNHENQGNPWISLSTSNTTDRKFHADANHRTDVPYVAELTSNMATEKIILTGNRLKLTLDWNDYNEQNLPINIHWDAASGWSYPDGSSHLETPEPDPAWPTFLTFDHLEELTFSAYNDGPGGIWFVFSGTRLVLTTNDGLNSYAAMPQYVNFTTAISPATTHAAISPTRDSMYIPDQSFAEIDFFPIQGPPNQDDNPCQDCRVPSGDYNAAIYLQGYDESGETFKRTINLGLVHITGNP